MSMSQPKSLGPFRIIRVIGRGGMGAVYEAVHEQTNETVALKVLTAPEEEEELHVRFEAEIGTLKRLRHPNIVRLYGFGEENGLQYYAMEFVDGPSLQHFLKQKRLFTWEEVVHIGIEVSKALKHAHDRGIIHRDIKPANILLLPDGQVKVSDYGIAHFFGDSRLTTANMVIGTIEYMAPEQAQAGPLTPKSDLYSLGALLYALITGNPPYQARTLPEIHKCYQMGPPESIRYSRPEVPSTLDQFIMELLRIQPEKRPKNAQIVARRLQAILLAFSRNKDKNPFKELAEEDKNGQNSGISSSASSLESFARSKNATRNGNYCSLTDEDDSGSIFRQSDTDSGIAFGTGDLSGKTPAVPPAGSSSGSLSATRYSDINSINANDSDDFDFSDSGLADQEEYDEDSFEENQTGSNTPGSSGDNSDDKLKSITHSTSLESGGSEDHDVNTDYQNTFCQSTGTESVCPKENDFESNISENNTSGKSDSDANFQNTIAQSTAEQGLDGEGASRTGDKDEFSAIPAQRPEDCHWNVDQIEAAFHIQGDGDTAVTEAIETQLAPQKIPQEDTRKNLESVFVPNPSALKKISGSEEKSSVSKQGWRATEFGLAQEKPLQPSGESASAAKENFVIIDNNIDNNGAQKTSGFDDSKAVSTPSGKTVDFDLADDLIKAEAEKKKQDSSNVFLPQGVSKDPLLSSGKSTAESEFSDRQNITERRSAASRFVMVREEELDDSYRNKRDFSSVSPLVWGGGLILILTGIFICYSLKRPSADVLYEKIERKINNNDNKEFGASLRGAESEISNFLKYYPNDFRVGKITDYYNEIQLGNLERRLEKQIEHGARNKNLSAIEIAYLEAIRTAGLDPEKGISKLRAFIQLFSVDGSLEMEDSLIDDEYSFGNNSGSDQGERSGEKRKSKGNVAEVRESGARPGSDLSANKSAGAKKEGEDNSKRLGGKIKNKEKKSSADVTDDSLEKVKKQRQALQTRTTSGQCVLLAHRRLESLLESFEKINVKQISLLESRLDHADAIEKDDPKHAGEIRLSIIILYKDYHWAVPLVERARLSDEKLKKSEAAKSDNVTPDNVTPDNVKSNNVKSDNVKPDNVTPNNGKTDNVKSDNVKPDNVKSNNVKSNNVKSDNVKSDNVKPDNVKPDNVKSRITMQKSAVPEQKKK